MGQGKAYGEDEVRALLREALVALTADGTPAGDLSVGRLCTHAGISRSTFYKYFEDRPAMLHALSADTLHRLYAAQRSWLARGAQATRADVRASMAALLQAYTGERAVLRATADAATTEPSLAAAYTSAVQDYARAIARFVRAGRTAGAIPDGPPAAETGAALAWMTERTVATAPPDADPAALADALTHVLTATLAIPDPT
ncbi:TetR/AcrR family transcriptional regulator [Paraconexibacter algicola]|uniref:HTH tetR-type domain-containing protein n=1 Tax=Paraconexibacter algicola TaxID=2133960 RepID=A0A2T4UGS1_9ACTN|nr:TetR/AcrR family transcriptional regulator [Paraconexibacter algicola]PTL58409.1 hypothetical protein C7Y72_01455 [Paraconexibacter algicola]